MNLAQKFAAALPFKQAKELKYSDIEKALEAVLPKVRKLRWERSEMSYVDDNGVTQVAARFWDAEAVGGSYQIMQLMDERHPNLHRKFVIPYDPEDQTFETLDEAMAHQQADYDKRISAELVGVE